MSVWQHLNSWLHRKESEKFTTNSSGETLVRTTAELQNDVGEAISVQHPLPTDGDSIYIKDLDIPNCDNGDFSGTVEDYFHSLTSVNTNTTSTNPKQIKIWLKRTLYTDSIGFGCNDLSGSFSNIKVELLGSGEVVRKTIDFSSDNTKYNSRVIQFEPSAMNGFILTFSTTDDVCLSNLTVRKSIQVESRLQALKDDGTLVNIAATDSGNLKVANVEDGLSIAQGKVAGTSSVRKFGDNPSIDTNTAPEDIWEFGGIYNFSTTADIDSISSSDAADTQEVVVQGLDTNWNEVSQTITLNGQTRVALTTPLLRCYRAYNNNGTDLEGMVYIYVNTAISSGVPSDDTKVRAVIDSHHNQTLMAIYTVPAGKTAYFMSSYVSLSNSKSTSAIMTFRMRLEGKVFRVVNKIAIQSTGSSQFVRNPAIPGSFPEKTDLAIRCEEVTANGVGVSAGFDLVLVDN